MKFARALHAMALEVVYPPAVNNALHPNRGRSLSSRARRMAILLYVLASLVGPWWLVAAGTFQWIAAPALWVALLFVVPGVYRHFRDANELSRTRRRRAMSP